MYQRASICTAWPKIAELTNNCKTPVEQVQISHRYHKVGLSLNARVENVSQEGHKANLHN